ncbi:MULTISPECIES: cytochrome c [Comamonadaceae]|uniref:SorU family sulfite dehydrogenase c-type cytochrome subunit n=1 Tax=Comamonadaceae TaxID=80864 RepID=UPI001F5B52BC|nr:cytochrome c [Acidovorax sp. 210-6]
MLGWVRGAGVLGTLLLGLAGPANAADPQVLARGKALFSTVQPACALCHTLKAAASSGQVGPNLDELQPDADRVLRAVREGLGVMPSFEGQLTEQDMRALAAFVAHSSGAAR